MIATSYRKYEQGVTSLVVVLFSVLLFVVVTVGFMQTMTTEQRASADDELSRGAYDSALAGVEDGKRVLQACLNGDGAACAAINAGRCTTISDAGFVAPETSGEVYLKSVSSTGSLTGQEYNQAYTCVKISLNSNYQGYVSEDQSVVIPLRTVSRINRVQIQWFMSKNSTDPLQVNLDPAADTSVSLPVRAAWPTDRPSIMRVQLMQFQGGNLDLNSLDQEGSGNTIYLYPKRVGSLAGFLGDTPRRNGLASPVMAQCGATFIGTYACTATLDLPDPVGGSADDRVAYLRLTSLYAGTDFAVTTYYGAAQVELNLVQPKIDSTGRAADVYRRIQASVELNDPDDVMLYPRATVDSTNSFCKAFAVTDNVDDFQDSCD